MNLFVVCHFGLLNRHFASISGHIFFNSKLDVFHVLQPCQLCFSSLLLSYYLYRIQKYGSLPLTKVGIHFGHVRMYATPYPISLIIFILDLGPSYTDKLLEFRWVQIAHLS